METGILHNIRSTSLAAYDHIKQSQQLGHQQLTILQFMYRAGKPVTRNQIERGTGMRISSVSGRVKGLIDLGFVEECGTTKDPITGRLVNLIRPKPDTGYQQDFGF